MEMEEKKANVSSKLVLFNKEDNKFLLLRRKITGEWGFAGGTRNINETLQDTLIREVSEEIGSDIQFTVIDSPIYAKRRIHKTVGEFVKITYLAIYESGNIKLSNEHEKYNWVNADEILKNKKYKMWVKENIKKAQERLNQMKYLDGWKRCQADFENYKKQQAESQKDIIKYSTENIVTQILPVLDNFQSAVEHIPEDQKDEAWVQGIMHIQKQLKTVLTDNGVEEIKVKTRDDFNPEIHEAIKSDSNTQMHSNDSNGIKIEKIILKGYKIGDKTIRPARVITK